MPAHTAGPPAHWHEMHDETFLVTAGTVRFRAPDGRTVDARAGDYVVVPTRAPHTFENATDHDARFFNTFTPAYYIHYFKLLAAMLGEAAPRLEPTVLVEAMARYATLPAPGM